MRPSWKLATALACSALLAGCGSHEPVSPRRGAIPVLVYGKVERKQFERDMDMLARAGYDTITLPAFVRYLRGQPVALPPRPFVLTFDGGRRDASSVADPVLEDRGFNAVVFVDTRRVDRGDASYLRWRELDAQQRSGRWDVQLRSGSGNFLIRYGPAPGDVGPWYAYRGTDEVLAGWRERVFRDITTAEEELARGVPGHRPLAFTPPYGNYGQAGTDDPAIPRLLLARLHLDYPVVFTQDRSPLARRGEGTAAPVGRLDMSRRDGEQRLRALIAGTS